MFELRDPHPTVDVQEAEFLRLLGFPRSHVLEGRARELADTTRAWYAENGRPWIYARQMDALDFHGDRLKFGSVEFSSPQLHEQFTVTRARHAVLVAVSAGPECEAKARQLWQEGKPDEYFFTEVFGSAVVEHLITVASGRICGWADANGMVALPHYSPGYSGWDATDQIPLWSLIRPDDSSSLPGDLEVMDTGMLRPKKSMLAVFGVTADIGKACRLARLVPCENCSLRGCQYRRLPYKRALPQIEDVRRLQRNQSARGPGSSPPPLSPSPRYSINDRALRKWSEERLELKQLPDGSVEARFRYDGTTCSNMGQPLQFDYHVKLASPAERYRIVQADCNPAPGDTGHTKQCEYLNDAAALMGNIAGEKPLLGLPLDDVLAWEREPMPSGCFCDLARRDHKWGLVYEVIHFSLNRKKTRTSNGQSPTLLK